jgi:hypothetical protein
MSHQNIVVNTQLPSECSDLILEPVFSLAVVGCHGKGTCTYISRNGSINFSCHVVNLRNKTSRNIRVSDESDKYIR